MGSRSEAVYLQLGRLYRLQC